MLSANSNLALRLSNSFSLSSSFLFIAFSSLSRFILSFFYSSIALPIASFRSLMKFFIAASNFFFLISPLTFFNFKKHKSHALFSLTRLFEQTPQTECEHNRQWCYLSLIFPNCILHTQQIFSYLKSFSEINVNLFPSI